MTWKMFLVTFIYGRSFELYIWWTFALEFLLIAQWFPKLQSKIELSRPGKLFYSSFSPQPVTWFDKHKQSKLHNLPVGVNLPKIWLWAGYFPKVRKNDKKEKKSLNTLKAFFKNASLNTLYVMRCAIWYQSLFGACMIVQTRTNACYRLHELAWHSNRSIKWQMFEGHSNG